MYLEQEDLRTELRRSRELASLTILNMLHLVFYFPIAFPYSHLKGRKYVLFIFVSPTVSTAVGHIAGAQAVLVLFWISWV